MTRSELDQAMGNVCYRVIAATLTHLKKRNPRMGKQIHISSYAYDDEVRRYYPRAVYALGDKPDAKKPESNPKLSKQKYLAKVYGKYRLNNVFNLGLSRDAIYELRKAA